MTSFQSGLVWFGAGVSIAEILTGTYFAPLGFGKGLAAILLGHLIGCAMMYFAGLIGGQTKKSAMETTKMSFGSKGCITADNETANNTTLYTESGVLREKPLHFFLERYNDAYIQEEADFVDACLNGTPTPVTAFDGLQPVLIAIAAKKSCELGGVPVKVGE